jgi:hypothetical protein
MAPESARDVMPRENSLLSSSTSLEILNKKILKRNADWYFTTETEKRK